MRSNQTRDERNDADTRCCGKIPPLAATASVAENGRWTLAAIPPDFASPLSAKEIETNQ